MPEIVLIAHDIRSCHNVGSLLRTAEGLGVSKVYLTGYTPFPKQPSDKRLPHIADKIHAQIQKTALGAEEMIAWEYNENILEVLRELSKRSYELVGLEQTNSSIDLPHFKPQDKIALILGREVEGIEQKIIDQCETLVHIPMQGKKESFNVVQAAAMALYHITFYKS